MNDGEESYGTLIDGNLVSIGELNVVLNFVINFLKDFLNDDADDLIVNKHVHVFVSLASKLFYDLAHNSQILGSNVSIAVPVSAIANLGDGSEGLDITYVSDGILSQLWSRRILNSPVKAPKESCNSQRSELIVLETLSSSILVNVELSWIVKNSFHFNVGLSLNMSFLLSISSTSKLMIMFYVYLVVISQLFSHEIKPELLYISRLFGHL